MNSFKTLLWLCCLVIALRGQGQIIETYQFNNLNLSVPDGDASGVSDTRTITSGITSISDVNVAIKISGRGSGAFNGDLYVTLTHESGFSVLLNRVGRRLGSVLGYSDNGFDITLDDQASNEDVHTYRLTLNGNNGTPLTTPPLTGLWGPDGRSTDPDSVLNTDARNSLLSVFNGQNGNGSWTLFVADIESGGTARLDSWSLFLTSVPEPRLYPVLAGTVLLGFAFLRRKMAWVLSIKKR